MAARQELAAATSTPLPPSNCTLGYTAGKPFKLMAYFTILFVSLLGNCFVVYVVFKKRKMRTVSNYFIVNMAAAALFITVFNMPANIEMIVSEQRDWPSGDWGDVVCKSLGFIQSMSVGVTVLTLAIISLDRFMSMLFPWRKIRTVTSYYLIGGTWLVAIAAMSPLLFSFRVTAMGDRFVCQEKWESFFINKKHASKTYTVVLFLMLYALPVSLVGVLSVFTLTKSHWFRPPCEHAHLHTPTEQDAKIEHSKRQFSYMVATMVVCFALCWLPMHVRTFLWYFRREKYPCGVPRDLDFVAQFFGHTSCALFSCVYFVFMESYRKQVKKILCKIFCRMSTRPKARNGTASRVV